ncbi:hypothetical protein RC62_3694 [Flavobacterium aquidurense]|uniref:Uncharacterized protein n=1 Tax=Flavobacterium aquidurense TaxID=362413 RepID=A0A0Q0Y1S5_9FLAO|nr:hypothetical protein RC62_3694 [Flavobacterium aquidurense]
MLNSTDILPTNYATLNYFSVIKTTDLLSKFVKYTPVKSNFRFIYHKKEMMDYWK